MNLGQFKDSFSYLFLPSTVLAFWFLTQEVAGPSPFNDTYFIVTEFAEFNEKHLGNTPLKYRSIVQDMLRSLTKTNQILRLLFSINFIVT